MQDAAPETKSSLFTEKVAWRLVYALLGALVYWLAVRWLWPWCGPWLVQPCPLPTPTGCYVAIGLGAVSGLTRCLQVELAANRRVRAAEFEAAYRRRERHIYQPLSPPPWRQP